MTHDEKLKKLIREYNKLIIRIDSVNAKHLEALDPLEERRQKLYTKIYNLSAKPTNAMIASVEAKLTAEEKKYTRVLWNTPPAFKLLDTGLIDE